MRRAAAALAVLTAACADEVGSPDPFPVPIDVAAGPVIAPVRDAADGEVRAAVLDVLAPLTVIDAADGAAPARRSTDLALLGDRGDGALVARAHLDVTVIDLHACPPGEPCRVGPGGAPVEIGAIVGGDAFAGTAVRFDLAGGTLGLYGHIPGTNPARGRLCEAVLATPFRGGGTLILGGTEISLPRRRIAINACLSYDDRDAADEVTDRGADALLVLSTGVGPTILSETAYERWRQAAGGTAPEAAALPVGSVWMPSGAISGRVGAIDRLAIVGGDQEIRGPCRQVYAHKLLSARDCAAGDDCPCTDAEFCRIPAVAELAPATPIEVLVVPDDEATLQALRTELRPETAEVDGILGTFALAAMSFDLDPGEDRVLLRCEAAGCRVRPELIGRSTRSLVDECRLRAEAAAGAGADAAVP